MVLPLLYGIGARDFVDLLGYVIEACPRCKTTGIFSVYQSKRKVTFYTLPTFAVREQQVIECRSCTARFAVPPELRETFAGRLMTQAEVVSKVRQSGSAIAASNGRRQGPTYYQTLQVDPAADPEVIEAAFRRLALKYHPDRSVVPDAADRMRDLLEARSILTDPARRRAYDATLGILPPRPQGFRPEDV